MDDDSNWYPFMTSFDDSPASVLVDRSWLDKGPDEKLTTSMIFAIPFEEPGPHGMGEEESMAAVDEEADPLLNDLSSRFGAAYVGCVRGSGFASFFLYISFKQVEPIKAHLKFVLGKRYMSPVTNNDPDWSTYFDELQPDPIEELISDSMLILNTLGEQGDDGSLPRKVDHEFFCPSEDAAKAIGEAMSHKGWTLAGITASEHDHEHKEGETCDHAPGFTVMLSNTMSVTPDSLMPMIHQCVDLADANDSMYGGWGSPVVKPE